VPPPLSVAIAADVGGLLRRAHPFRLGDHHSWVRWFAETIRGTGQAQRNLIVEVDALKQQWQDLLGTRPGRAVRSDAAAWRVLDMLLAT
jgi:hypothetical protein